ncbi:dihydrolipoyl dehydrogenase [Tuwongella immobilis]|uniref:Dihydrolipoyl dehydrogenase n=1 Tax=Tuwongella immobilis TaxID=692036 RepID=A0A6C2YPH5_9BACT|nr:dihydrolipoyl dehydrogenase [Tuwongella immobilis]VIP03304.1 dihydrolipoamide dehydrogenase : Dihydrolipoyl dehydrogenase OS=Planctomyces brasiliensis (strain ATCC 49424 / DSM 5305 / JCM 21570 / NBRC 103401 / IFAM 1448) GN=Plabr_4534 PE=3 SV=1: Pyr_redox_2: Pyr_redox: Pyr_redox_dim [Tuwongella immobilis]VTS03979.1 dihydrolipoamide dehydrogenase : Dihydrolipoyl dehydrogenase OS=Planctomyces brasiliensis (strain ATCC 49424 / DSM 5305 / JCM 21570 / NBRC 103401 / IFAM 1448) GN=Plabr_4534 PE=3 SV=1
MAESIRETEVLVIGAGPGGYPAAIMAADHGKKVLLVDQDPKLGGVCLNRGCIPSKALLHVAKLIRETRESADHGLTFGEPQLDLDKLRGFVGNKVISKMNSGISSLVKGRQIDTIRAKAIFESPNTVRLEGETNGLIRFQYCVIATGSVPAMPKAFAIGDPRVMDSTGALLLPDVPKSLLVVGGGYIGLEIGSVYSALGTNVTVVEFADRLLPLADSDLVKPLHDRLAKHFEAIYLKTSVESIEAKPEGILAKLKGDGAPASVMFDRVLVSVGRRPNSVGIGLDKAGISVDERGFIVVDPQRRTTVPNIYAIGDVAGDPGLAHKATAEAKVAVESILGEKTEWAPRTIPAVIYTDPELAWCGSTERELKAANIPHEVRKFPWQASGRATSLARPEGLTKLIVDPESQRILGLGIVGVGAGDLISEGVLAIEMGAVARDLADSIHPHPTLSETIMEAADLALGATVHLPRMKKG